MSKKVSFLGGGSPFTPSLLYVLAENKESLQGSEIWLMDIDESRLPKLTELGEEMSERFDADLSFSHTTKPEEALEGADFVFFGYRVGGLEHMKHDIEIPTKYGISGDETTGPGGTFMAQCTIPTTLKYCRLMEDLCPDAWAISYVNPANFISDAVITMTDVDFISICDCIASFNMEYLPRLFDLPPYERKYTRTDDIKSRAIGVNHLTWVVELTVEGKKAYPKLERKLKERINNQPHDQYSGFLKELMDIYGYVHPCSFHALPYWKQRDFLESRKNGIQHEEQVLGWSNERWSFVEDMTSGTKYEKHPDDYCFHLYHARHAIGIMVSIIEDEGREWGGINYPNNGAISNLPKGSIVEGPCLVDSDGLTPISMGEVPYPIEGITKQVINWEELSVDAALTGNENRLLQALLACPYVNDIDSAKKTMDELLDAHREYMPQFQD